ncbi:hypothetical protein VCRA2110O318_10172 [Vibrio crassostreae]|nr:hypothetical protein VCRA2117O328_20173 [Vibrio crassostreae]CAK2291915.1 hypothetical protein VCRA2110O318_10172 [Vibrio crassostreae]CAK2471511.1 hypothetical protein VCRA2110O319_20173 [Vibrio crassostreae]CAK2725549.1 hypothetical protein VCRA217O317_10242 [Vibrio crassostreae]
MYKTIQWDAKHNSLPINLYQSLKRYVLTTQHFNHNSIKP